ncbi:unnamed protein product [Lupinus luteus]|uniref:Uncharacterized protein n=1 Tax=Lupinus luteus TaxID=3873 RepID=A0AAV1YJM7_LUPLU
MLLNFQKLEKLVICVKSGKSTKNLSSYPNRAHNIYDLKYSIREMSIHHYVIYQMA